jgi:hypothetical protein
MIYLRKNRKFLSLSFSCLLFAIVLLFAQSCLFVPSNKLNDTFSIGLVMGEGHLYYIDSYGQPIVLIENKNAADPTYKELVDFLGADITDRYPYIQSATQEIDLSTTHGDPRRMVDRDWWLQIINGQTYQSIPRICSDFAETLHNNAEIHGIRAGYVTIELSSSTIGHAIAVFNTTDRGLVFIDDTGEAPQTQISSPGSVSFGITDDCDKVAYLEKGKPFGSVSLEVAEQYGLDYSGYEKWLSTKQEFDSLSLQYDNIKAGRSSVPRDDYIRLQNILSQMKDISNRLGGFWGGFDGVVTDYTITWEGQW